MQKSLTVAPVKPGNVDRLTPEFARMAGIERLFGIKRGTLYNLLESGRISGVLLRSTGTKSGLRLIDVASVRDFIRREMARAEREAEQSEATAKERA